MGIPKINGIKIMKKELITAIIVDALFTLAIIFCVYMSFKMPSMNQKLIFVLAGTIITFFDFKVAKKNAGNLLSN